MYLLTSGDNLLLGIQYPFQSQGQNVTHNNIETQGRLHISIKKVKYQKIITLYVPFTEQLLSETFSYCY